MVGFEYDELGVVAVTLELAEPLPPEVWVRLSDWMFHPYASNGRQRKSDGCLHIHRKGLVEVIRLKGALPVYVKDRKVLKFNVDSATVEMEETS